MVLNQPATVWMQAAEPDEIRDKLEVVKLIGLSSLYTDWVLLGKFFRICYKSELRHCLCNRSILPCMLFLSKNIDDCCANSLRACQRHHTAGAVQSYLLGCTASEHLQAIQNALHLLPLLLQVDTQMTALTAKSCMELKQQA